MKAADGGRPTQGDLVYVTDGTWQSVKGGKLDPDVTKALAKLGFEDMTEAERVGLSVIERDDKDSQPYVLSCQTKRRRTASRLCPVC